MRLSTREPSRLCSPVGGHRMFSQQVLTRRAARRLAVISSAACSGLFVPKRGAFATVVTAEQTAKTAKAGDAPAMGWVVADMDGTLVGLPGFVSRGRYEAPTLAQSACRQPLRRWLRAGGRLLVVTSDDGDGPFRRILSDMPPELLPRVMFSTSDGAALFDCQPSGELVAAEGYGTDYCLRPEPEYLQSVYNIALKMHRAFLHDLASDPGLFASLDDTLRAGYSAVLGSVARGETSFEEAVTTDTMLLPGRVKTFGTLVTRKQAGPSSHWVKIPDDAAVGGGGGVIPAELPKNWTKARYEAFERTCCPNLVAPFTCVILLGMPHHVSERYVQLVAADLAELGLTASRAPNSVWIKRPGVGKSVPVHWLLQSAAFGGFAPEDAIAFGDMPLGNDAPLASFSSQGMPFVSVGSDAAAEGPRRFHVGGNERGMAAVLSVLAEALEEELAAAGAEHRAPRRLGALGVDVAAAVARAAASLRPGE